MSGEQAKTEERIKQTAMNIDNLIVRLNTLTNRIDTANANKNAELTEYYERQFAEASVEFMDSVESILDDWYVLNGGTRPPARMENISPEMLENIHNAVVAIVQGLPFELPDPILPSHIIDEAQGVNVLQSAGENIGKQRNKVDFTG
jgi:hypothetical protein